MRRAVLVLAAALAVAGCGGRAAGPQRAPATLPGDRGRLVAWTGSGAHRLALYAARGSHGVVCTGATVGVVDGSAARVTETGSYPERVLPLAAAPGLRGLRVFAAQIGNGMAGLDARDGAGHELLDLPSSPLASPCQQRNCTDLEGQPPWRELLPLVPSGQDRAARIALAEPGLAKVLRDHSGWIQSEDRWTSCNGRLLGRVVVIRLRDASTFRATVPFVSFPKKPVAYYTGVHRILALHARELDVSVDLNSGRVVGVEPDTIAVPLGTVEQQRPAGGPDSTGCWSSGD